MIFRNWVLQNFPFIEDDFDALTDYELFSKVVEYMRKSLEQLEEYKGDIDEFSEELTEFRNYFDNLDVQEEVDTKIDEMVTDGTMDTIINQEVFGELNTRLGVAEEQIHLKKYDLVFDVTTAEVGDIVTAHSTNSVPSIEGYTIMGYLPYSCTYPDANFIVATDMSEGKIYSILELGYKGSDTEIYATGYIVYAKTGLIDTTPIT